MSAVSWADMSLEARQSVAAMNARVYAMSEPDRERWYAEHPPKSFAEPTDNVRAA